MNTSINVLDLSNLRITKGPYAGWFATARHYYGNQILGDGNAPVVPTGAFGTARDSGVDFLLPGGGRHYLALLGSDADMETKILLSGITKQYQITFGVGCCSTPSLEASGLALIIANQVSMTTGAAEIPVDFFTNYVGLPVGKLKRLNRQLIASGVWEINEDEDAWMITYELTTFGLAQIAASRDLVNAYQTEDQPIGPYINVVMQVPDIEVRMQELMSFLDSLQSTATA